MPVTEEIIRDGFFQRFLMGKCPDTEFERKMMEYFSDPAYFSRMFYDFGGNRNAKDQFFGNWIDDVMESVHRIQKLFESLREFNADILKARRSLVAAGLDKREARRRAKQVSTSFLYKDLEDVKNRLEGFVGQGRAGHFCHYITRVTKAGFNPKPSDVFDLMHMCYAYDCDLFRCDKPMGSVFSNYDPFREKLVDSFFDLSHRISMKLQ